MWRTVLPFCFLGWTTSALFLLQQRLIARKIVRDSLAIERSLSMADLINGDSQAALGDERRTRANTTKIVMLVTSSWKSKSYDNRAMFRNSTLLFLPDLNTNVEIEYRFVMGMRPAVGQDLTDEVALMQESKKWNDIMIVKTADGYDDLSRKMLAAWSWAASRPCDYVLKTDDDIFVRLDTVTTELSQLGHQREYWRGFAYWCVESHRCICEESDGLESQGHSSDTRLDKQKCRSFV